MSMDSIRQELDELMGKDRDLPIEERLRRGAKDHYDKPENIEINKKVCPHDLFPNTKCDLGKCTKRHDGYFKRQFEEDPSRFPNELRYINDTLSLIDSLVSNIDQKIKRQQNKIDGPSQFEKPKEIQEKINQYDDEIKKKLEAAEQLGEQGKIEQTEAVMAEIENLKKRREELNNFGINPQKVMKVQNQKQFDICEICGALQAINDTEKRIIAHMEGKLHTGFKVLREEQARLLLRREEIKALMSRMEPYVPGMFDEFSIKVDAGEQEKPKEKENEKLREKSRDKKSREKRHHSHRRRSRSRSISKSHKNHHRAEQKNHHKKHKHKKRQDSSSQSVSKSKPKEKKESQ